MISSDEAFHTMDCTDVTSDNSQSGKSSILHQLQSFKYRHRGEKDDIHGDGCKLKPKPVTVTARDSGASSEVSSLLENSQQGSVSIDENCAEALRTEVPNEDMECSEESVTLSGNKDVSEADLKIEESRSNIIRPINRDVVHQICSGQVIVTLCTAVKELVENSLDAGAKKIDIRLVEYGSKLIEVSDDASGIEESNFEGLALKHHTSKIADFEDLETLSTFGFRGEALSSLCALANLTVVTRHKDSEHKSGHRIEYNYKGEITSKTNCARDFGTTIILKDLFHTLPVRHKEFNKNLKKEYHRMINILYGYCLVVDGVRITCTNQVDKGGPQKVFAMPAYNSMKERIVTLFGSKQLSSLIEIKQSDDIPEEVLSEFGLKTFERKYNLEGYISKPNHGRSSNDRQFYFINSRPCDPAKISRIVNEVYHAFSRQQNPFVCLHIRTNRENVDVNVTPDKRTLYVQNEKILLASLKASLEPLLSSAASTFNTSQPELQQTLLFSQNSQSDKDESSFCLSSSFKIRADRKPSAGWGNSSGAFDKQYSGFSGNLSRCTTTRTTSFIKSFSRDVCNNSRTFQTDVRTVTSFKRRREEEQTEYDQKHANISSSLNCLEVVGSKDIEDGTNNVEQNDEMEIETQVDSDSREIVESRVESEESDEEVIYDDEDENGESEYLSQRCSVSIQVDWQSISQTLTCKAMKIGEVDTANTYVRNFRAKISPQENEAAEKELQKQITKDMFSRMKILGQFNLGFIIVKNGSDLFIVDQHASDEKYNYEDLERNTVLNGQQLFNPLALDLPAVSENIIMDNIETFQKNGFFFLITPSEEPRKRVQLQKIPFSKNIQFGKSDVEELIFMLDDGSSGKAFYRPTKVRDMFASRACRKSVMIGTALSVKEMRSIIDHMGEMDQPWNCPHGRPTLRHLINLNLLPDLELTKFNH